MESYKDALITRAQAIAPSHVSALLSDAGGLSNAIEIAAKSGFPLNKLNDWSTGAAAISWPDFQYLAVALDLHPLYERTSVKPSPWKIHPDAVHQYQQLHLDPCDFEDAMDDLAEMARELVALGAQPRENADSTRTYRGPKPWRLALDVRKEDGAWVLFNVRPPSFGGLHVTVDRRKTFDFDPHSFANFLSPFLAKLFPGTDVSTSVGTRGMLVGVPREKYDQALATFRNEELAKMREQVRLLDQSIICWHQDQDRDRNANLARRAALGILQLAETHSKILKLESMERAMLERLSILQPNDWHQVLDDYRKEALRCASRLDASLRALG